MTRAPLQVSTPRQVDIVAVEGNSRVEAPERAKEIGAHEHAGRGHHEHVVHRVVLLLIDLLRFGDRVDLAEPVEPESDVLEQRRPVPVDQLGTDDARIGPIELFDEDPDGVAFGRDVVVTHQEEPVVALDELQHLVGQRAKATIAPRPMDEGVRSRRSDSLFGRRGSSSSAEAASTKSRRRLG